MFAANLLTLLFATPPEQRGNSPSGAVTTMSASPSGFQHLLENIFAGKSGSFSLENLSIRELQAKAAEAKLIPLAEPVELPLKGETVSLTVNELQIYSTRDDFKPSTYFVILKGTFTDVVPSPHTKGVVKTQRKEKTTPIFPSLPQPDNQAQVTVWVPIQLAQGETPLSNRTQGTAATNSPFPLAIRVEVGNGEWLPVFSSQQSWAVNPGIVGALLQVAGEGVELNAKGMVNDHSLGGTSVLPQQQNGGFQAGGVSPQGALRPWDVSSRVATANKITPAVAKMVNPPEIMNTLMDNAMPGESNGATLANASSMLQIEANPASAPKGAWQAGQGNVSKGNLRLRGVSGFLDAQLEMPSGAKRNAGKVLTSDQIPQSQQPQRLEWSPQGRKLLQQLVARVFQEFHVPTNAATAQPAEPPALFSQGGHGDAVHTVVQSSKTPMGVSSVKMGDIPAVPGKAFLLHPLTVGDITATTGNNQETQPVVVRPQRFDSLPVRPIVRPYGKLVAKGVLKIQTQMAGGTANILVEVPSEVPPEGLRPAVPIFTQAKPMVSGSGGNDQLPGESLPLWSPARKGSNFAAQQPHQKNAEYASNLWENGNSMHEASITRWAGESFRHVFHKGLQGAMAGAGKAIGKGMMQVPMVQRIEDLVALMGKWVERVRYQNQPGYQTMQIQLQPESLGMVRMMISMKENKLQAHIETQRPEAAALIQQHSQQLISRLQELNVQVQQFDVQTQSDWNAFHAQAEGRQQSSKEQQRYAAAPEGGIPEEEGRRPRWVGYNTIDVFA